MIKRNQTELTVGKSQWSKNIYIDIRSIINRVQGSWQEREDQEFDYETGRPMWW